MPSKEIFHVSSSLTKFEWRESVTQNQTEFEKIQIFRVKNSEPWLNVSLIFFTNPQKKREDSFLIFWWIVADFHQFWNLKKSNNSFLWKITMGLTPILSSKPVLLKKIVKSRGAYVQMEDFKAISFKEFTRDGKDWCQGFFFVLNLRTQSFSREKSLLVLYRNPVFVVPFFFLSSGFLRKSEKNDRK